MYQGKYSHSSPVNDPEMEQLNQKRVRRAQKIAEKKARHSTVLFYSIYGISVAAFLIVMLCILAPFRNWLIRYEASQPEQKAQEVFTQLFADPDWAALYTQSGMEDTSFETKETFAAYMDSKVGDSQLTYLETSAGLSGDHKYIVRLGDEKIASFRLTGGSNSLSEISLWELGAVELFFDRTESVIVEKHPSHTVYINGIALDDSYTIRTVTTKAEEYLPEGVTGYRAHQQRVENLLKTPEVTAADASGNPVEMVLDTATGIYKPKASAGSAMTGEEKELALAAAKADAAFAIRAISQSQLRKYFDSSSQVYADIVGTYPFLQSYQGYSFVESKYQVSDFYRYNDTLFSVNVSLQMNVTRSNGTTKEVPMSKTYFFTKNSGGKYLVTQYTNISVQEPVEQVRLTFQTEDKVLGTQMVSRTAASLTLPQITPAEGQVFQGWAKKNVDENGSITMTILFTPNADGTVQLSTGAVLEPMTLYAVFAAGEVTE